MKNCILQRHYRAITVSIRHCMGGHHLKVSLLLLLLLFNTLMAAAVDLQDDKVYSIKSGSRERYLAASNSSSLTAASTISLEGFWLVKEAGSGYVTLFNMKYNKYLGVLTNGSLTMSGSVVSNAFKWIAGNETLKNAGNNYWLVYSTSAGTFSTSRSKSTLEFIEAPQVVHKQDPFQTGWDRFGMQRTHENIQLVYLKRGESKTLRVPVESASRMEGYYRWYDYKTDFVSEGLEKRTNLVMTANGYIWYNGCSYPSSSPVAIGYTFNNMGIPDTVACDVSQFENFSDNLSSQKTFREPTLSYRMVYIIKDAQEMAQQLNQYRNTGYLETYQITAPAGKEVKITPAYNFDNYYAGTSPSQGVAFKWNSGADKNDANARFYTVAAGNAGSSKEITLRVKCGNVYYNVAKFNILFVADAEPAIEKELVESRRLATLDNNFQLVTKLDFDKVYTDGAYPKPLEWEESTYGFSFPVLKDLRSKEGYHPNWSEYGLFSSMNVMSENTSSNYGWSTGAVVKDRKYYTSGKKDKGYFVYVDASEKPGTLANLKFNEVLCPGTRLFVSAWIANLNSDLSLTNPNLNFVLKGRKDEQEEIIHRFTTGDILYRETKDTVEWQQIFYEVAFNTDVDYELYFLEVVNNGTSSSGNDLGLDDVRIYRTKPNVSARQETPLCNQQTTVSVSIDFSKMTEAWLSGVSYNLYYQFLENDKTTPVECDYYGAIEGKYGKLKLTKGQLVSESPEIYNFEIKNGTVYLNLIQNQQYLKPTQYYYVALSWNQKDNYIPTFDLSNPCDWFARFYVTPSSRLIIDGVVQSDNQPLNICKDRVASLSALLNGIHNGDSVSVQVYFDWYKGSLLSFETEIPSIGYSLKSVLSNFRISNANVSDLNDVVLSEHFTREMLAILKELEVEGSLVIYKQTLYPEVKVGDNYFVLVPICDGDVVEENGEEIRICASPIEVVLNAVKSSPILKFGNPEIKYPDDYEGYPAIRIGINQLVQNLEIPIRESQNAVWDQEHGTVILISTTDSEAEYLLGKDLNGDISLLDDEFTVIAEEQISPEYMRVNVSKLGIDFREGYEYILRINLQRSEINGCEGTAILPIKVVPSHLTWAPVNGSSEWNDDRNWSRSLRSDADLTIYENDTEADGYVPLSLSNVTIRRADVYPSLTDIAKKEDGSYHLPGNPDSGIEYDLNFLTNNCQHIYFQSGTELVGQDHLLYNKAWLDFTLEQDRWYMLSSPLQEVFAGDMHLPEDGIDRNEPFNTITGVTNRISPMVFQRSWDKSGLDYSWAGSKDMFVSSQWSNAFNDMDVHYAPGHGYGLWIDHSSSGRFRLPKEDEEYYYYTDYGVQSQKKVSIDRIKENIGRLVYPQSPAGLTVEIVNQTDGHNVFLIGNPFMCHIDMVAFLNGNPDLIRKYWVQSEMLLGVLVGRDNVLTVNDTEEPLTRFLAPMQSFFVQTERENVNSFSVKFTSDMMASSDSRLRSPLNNELTSQEILYMQTEYKGQMSKAVVIRDASASDDYSEGEDLQTLIDINTPSVPVIYSVADNRALMINSLTGENLIPLGINSAIDEDVKISFTGMESFKSPVFLYDAMNENFTELSSENNEFLFPGKCYDRFFLKITPVANGMDPEMPSKLKAYSPQKGKLIVSTSGSDRLRKIEIVTMNGTLVQRRVASRNIEYFDVHEGNYLIRIESLEDCKTIKILIR